MYVVNDESVVFGVVCIGWVIIVVVLVMFMLFVVLIVVYVLFMWMFGFGLILVVVVDVILVWMVVVLVFMYVMGCWNWWVLRFLVWLYEWFGVSEVVELVLRRCFYVGGLGKIVG